MRHFNYESVERKKEIFFKEPENFTKYTEKEILSYALGATLYMPATKADIAKIIIEKKFTDMTSVVIDLEDAIGDNDLQKAESQLYAHIQQIENALVEQIISVDDLPLIFIRVRNPKQMKDVTLKLGSIQRVLTGYVFPKFSQENGKEFLSILKENNKDGILLYGMPILETEEILFKELRMDSLLKIKKLVDIYKPYILNIRVGATDFCGLFGIRRKADTTIYDVTLVRDCLTDILNVFGRQKDGYVISGPVWEFFSKEERILKPKLRMSPFQERYGNEGLAKRTEMINEYVDGLINEVVLDKLNGIVGKTVIHPTHIKPVHSQYIVTLEEYTDALSIISNNVGQVGVLKSEYENKMNEMKPHQYWAKRVLLRANAFGVYNEDHDFTSLIIENQQKPTKNKVHEVTSGERTVSNKEVSHIR